MHRNMSSPSNALVVIGPWDVQMEQMTPHWMAYVFFFFMNFVEFHDDCMVVTCASDPGTDTELFRRQRGRPCNRSIKRRTAILWIGPEKSPHVSTLSSLISCIFLLFSSSYSHVLLLGLRNFREASPDAEILDTFWSWSLRGKRIFRTHYWFTPSQPLNQH